MVCKKSKIEVIAEIGQAHDGSVGILHSMIDAAAHSGANTVKFQTHIAEAESSESEPFRKAFSYVDKTRYQYWKRMELPLEVWKCIKDHCDERGVRFLSSPFSCAAVELLERIGVERFKVGSGEVGNTLILDRLALYWSTDTGHFF
jgi:N-acetylneuraminate synthase